MLRTFGRNSLYGIGAICGIALGLLLVGNAWSLDTEEKAVCRVVGVQTDELPNGTLGPATISRGRCRPDNQTDPSWISEGTHLGNALLLEAKIDDVFECTWLRSRHRIYRYEMYGDYEFHDCQMRRI